MKKLFALVLAVLMALSLWACGKSNGEYLPSADSTEPVALMPNEAGKLTVYGEADLQLVYNESGNVIAVTALNEQAEPIASTYDFVEKACPLAVMELIDLIVDQNLTIDKGFVLVRQEPGSAAISEDFLKNILEDAQLNKGSYAVIVTGADELDKDGQFSKETALAALKAGQPMVEGCTLNCSDTPMGGSYTIYCTSVDGVTTEYSVSAIDGSAIVLENAEEGEPQELQETEPIPETDIFDPNPDIDGLQGTDGGVDNGSVDFD